MNTYTTIALFVICLAVALAAAHYVLVHILHEEPSEAAVVFAAAVLSVPAHMLVHGIVKHFSN